MNMSDELLIKYIQGGCTEEESRAILSWIEENDENKTRYKELMLICSLTDFYMPSYQKEKKQVSWIKIAIGIAACSLGIFWGLSKFANSNQDSIEKYQALLSDVEKRTEITLKVADKQIVSLKDTSALISYNNNRKIVINDSTQIEKKEGKQLNAVFVPYGKRTKLVLADSSTVYLNSGSSLVYPDEFDSDKREVYLEGEAYFKVVKDGKSSFCVRTAYKSVEVLGTQFNVLSDQEAELFQTVLVSGKIALDGNNETMILEPNQCYTYAADNAEEKLESVDVSNYISWIDGRLKFEKEALSNVIRKLEKIYNVRILLKDKNLDGMLISGRLDLKNPLVNILNSLLFTVSSDEMESKYEIITNEK